MKALLAIAVGTLVLTGCTSTLTVGPKANENMVLGASANTEGASLTLPLVKASVGTTTTTKTTKKK